MPDGAAPVGALLKAIGMTLVSSVGGAAGPLYGTLFLRMAAASGDASALTVEQWSAALEAGVAGAQARGKAEPDDKTMIDALLPAVAALRAAVAAGRAPGDALRESAAAAERGMKATTPLVARKGRASYLGERSAGTQDPRRDLVLAAARGGRRHAVRGVRFVIGLVLVSHSARLAEGVAELAAQMAGPDLAIAVAGGLDLPGKPLGTDAALVAQAIERVWSPDGVLVLMDLGSAVLSAELALDLLPDERRAGVLLCDAPWSREPWPPPWRRPSAAPSKSVAGEARGGLAAKVAQLAPAEAAPAEPAPPQNPRPASPRPARPRL